MNRSQFAVVLMVAASSGLVGGGLTSWLFQSQNAHAQEAMLHFAEKKKSSSVKKVVSAKEFRLVDDNKNILAILGVEENDQVGKQIGWTIFDEQGNKRVRLYGAKYAAAIDLFDSQGNVRFHAGEENPGGQMSIAKYFMADTSGKPAIKCELGSMGGLLAQFTDPQGRGLIVGASPLKPKPYVKLVGGSTGSPLWSAP